VSTTAVASASPASDAAAAMARVAQLQQMLAEAAQGPAASPATTPATSASTGTQNFATMLASASGATATATSAPAGYAAYSGLITQAAARYGIDPSLLYGVISQESGFNPNAVSSAGAEGLAQIMPANFASLGITNPFDPAQSINAGAQMLAENLKTFGGNTSEALAAYNAGVGAVQHYGGIPPYAETQNYVQSVLAFAAQYPGASAAATGTPTVATLV